MNYLIIWCLLGLVLSKSGGGSSKSSSSSSSKSSSSSSSSSSKSSSSSSSSSSKSSSGSSWTSSSGSSNSNSQKSNTGVVVVYSSSDKTKSKSNPISIPIYSVRTRGTNKVNSTNSVLYTTNVTSAYQYGYSTVYDFPSTVNVSKEFSFSNRNDMLYQSKFSTENTYYNQIGYSSDCTAFAINPNITQSIDIPLQNKTDSIHYNGDLSVSSASLSMTLQLLTSNLDTNTIQTLNNFKSLPNIDTTINTLFRSLVETYTYNLTRVVLTDSTGSMKGVLFSIPDLSSLSGTFTFKQTTITINGQLTPLNSFQINLFQLNNILDIQLDNSIESFTSISISTGSTVNSNINLSGLNITGSVSQLFNSGSVTFTGDVIQLNECPVVGSESYEKSNISSPAMIGGFACVFALVILYRKFLGSATKLPPPIPINQGRPILNSAPMDQNNHASVIAPHQSYQSPINGYQQTAKMYQAPPPVANSYASAMTVFPSPQYHAATTESLQRALQFLAAYPPGSREAYEAAHATSNIPPSMIHSPCPITMMQPRLFTHFGFTYPVTPQVDIGTIDPYSGKQFVRFTTMEDCSIQSNVPMLPHRLSSMYGYSSTPLPPPSYSANQIVDECYYQVKILRKPVADSTVAIGFAGCPYPPFRLPGWDIQSVAYHSDDGSVFMNDFNDGISCGPSATEGDTIGVGYKVIYVPLSNGQYQSRLSFYFTHNQMRLNQEFSQDGFIPHLLFPTIGTDGDCDLEIFFGNVQQTFFQS
ncbi:Rsp5p-dependent ubiquitination, sorting of cargo proteins at the multivesicular body [Globomyces sp. JEL0801]|nr:Rsp5p-dependent ubiquitination, sorting of cargo proteins at the multivesicular body [Globomyces sp. JEL0801]